VHPISTPVRRTTITKTVKVAVYGTLRSSHSNHSLLGPDAKVLQKDLLLPGFTLYNLGWYPGVVRDADGPGVVVEVVEIPVAVLERLDAYEGYDVDTPETSLFLRERVTLPDGERVSIYTYNDVIRDGTSIISDGKWCNE